MTLCIAAICSSNFQALLGWRDTIIMVADAMVSRVVTHTESGLKIRLLGQGWWSMFAAGDVSEADQIIKNIRGVLLEDQSASGNLQRMQAIVKSEYDRLRLQKAESLILPPGLSIERFYTEAKNILTERVFETYLAEMRRVSVECELLVAGFDQQDKAHLFSVGSDPYHTQVDSWDVVGFHAIGSGSPNAIAMLSEREQRAETLPGQTLYQAYEAKRFGEKALGVGKHTDVVRLTSGKVEPLPPPAHQKLDQIYKKLSVKPWPTGKDGAVLENTLAEESNFASITFVEAVPPSSADNGNDSS